MLSTNQSIRLFFREPRRPPVMEIDHHWIRPLLRRRRGVGATVNMKMLGVHWTISGWWYTYPSEKYESQMG